MTRFLVVLDIEAETEDKTEMEKRNVERFFSKYHNNGTINGTSIHITDTIIKEVRS